MTQTAEELEAVFPATVIDVGDVPLAELRALGPEVIRRAIGRAVPGGTASTQQAGAFQSAP